MTEAQLQTAVIQLARFMGWRVAHFRPAQMQSGRWATPVQGDGRGFPDLVLARQGDVVFAELKSARGVLRPEQHDWIAELRGAQVRVFVWTPADWHAGLIEAELRREEERSAA